jgi:hypothetical protein
MERHVIAGLLSQQLNKVFGSNDCDVGGTRGVLGVHKFKRSGFRINSEAFDAVSVLARHKQVLTTWVEREVSSIRVSRERVST